jgi:hypothetical protein
MNTTTRFNRPMLLQLLAYWKNQKQKDNRLAVRQIKMINEQLEMV